MGVVKDSQGNDVSYDDGVTWDDVVDLNPLNIDWNKEGDEDEPGDEGEPMDELPEPNVVLQRRKRDPKFAVIVEGRLPRENTVLTQVSIPLDLHHRLRRDSLGSLNQVLMGLVRYALERLDEDDDTLYIARKKK